jgi:hypothetical protein
VDFQIVSCKGTETFTTAREAAEWLEEMQPATAEVEVDGNRAAIPWGNDEYEDGDDLRAAVCAAYQAALAA